MDAEIEVVGCACVNLTAVGGKSITEWIYVVRGHKTEALLGAEAAKALGILHICPEGEVNRVEHVQDKDDEGVMELVEQYDKLFEGIGKIRGQVVNFQIDPDVRLVVQKERRVPLGYQQKLSQHLEELKQHDVIEGPLDSTVGHNWISNVVITEKKDHKKIRMTVDMRHANMAIKPTHFPVPTVQELRHKLAPLNSVKSI